MLPRSETFNTPGARSCSWRSTASVARCTQVQSRLPFKGCTQISCRCRPIQGPRYLCAATFAYSSVAPCPVTVGLTPGQAGTVLSAHADDLCTTTSRLSVTYFPIGKLLSNSWKDQAASGALALIMSPKTQQSAYLSRDTKDSSECKHRPKLDSGATDAITRSPER